MQLFDAHNHLQQVEIQDNWPVVLQTLRQVRVQKIVVNGTRESDWPLVRSLAAAHDFVLPAFGLHPWYVSQRSQAWEDNLLEQLESKGACIGEVGLDRWIEGYDLPVQRAVLEFQLGLAARKNVPVCVHCLKAWGALLEVLERGPRPECGILLHSYGGPKEMIQPLAKLGAYFSISGYFAHERKHGQRDVFKAVPLDRLLIETDAPDMLPPETLREFELSDIEGKAVNHPGNIRAVYRFVAELLEIPLNELAGQISANFARLFGPG